MRTVSPGWVSDYLQQLPNTVVTKNAEGNQLSIDVANSGSFDFQVVPKTYLSGSDAENLVNKLQHLEIFSNKIPLLVVRRLTKETRKNFSTHGWSWIEEETGIVNLQGPGLYVHTSVDVTPQVQEEKKRPTRFRGLSGRCAEALLLLGHRNRTLTTGALARAANVSAATASYVLQRLERDDIVVSRGSGRRNKTWEIHNLNLVLDLWALEESFARARTTKAYIWSSTPRDLLRHLLQLNKRTRPWAIGGSAAANIYAPTLTVEPTLKVWLCEQESVDALIQEFAGEKVSTGYNIEFMQIRDDPWALYSTSAIGRSAVDADAGVQQELTAPIVTQDDLATLRLVSRPRAYVETCYNATGRDADVALTLRHTMKLD